MGSTTFETYSSGADVNTSFRAAVDTAAYEHGHGGYSGTIAEKTDFVIITRRPVSYDEASHLAGELLDRDDPRVADKWGPAGAIPVKQTTRTAVLDNVPPRPRSGPPADHLARMSRIARDRGLMAEDENATDGHWLTGDRFSLTIAKSPAALSAQTQPDGWLFFGWAST